MKQQWLLWLAKGAVMGMADAVPGVSGGTMALITGIYERLIKALSGLHPGLLLVLWRRQWRLFWVQSDGAFLLSLGLGIVISLFSVLNLVHWLLQSAPQLLWAFFMGLIVASLWSLGRKHPWCKLDLVLLVTGTIIATGVSLLTGLTLTVTPWTLMLGGALAISAMLLPGISGSFILLLLGLYPEVVSAVHERNLVIIGWVALGCVIGLLGFSRILQALLKRWHDRVMAFMLGFILGALVKVWPWQYDNQWLGPAQFERVSGEPAMFFGAVLALVAGAVSVVLLSWKVDQLAGRGL